LIIFHTLGKQQPNKRMSVKLRKRKNKDGSITLLLDIYHNGERHYEFLKELRLSKPTSPIDRLRNKENMDLAERIAIKKAHELAANDYEITTDLGKKTIVCDWMHNYVESYKKKDKRNMQGALNRFRQFLLEENKQGLTFGKLNEVIIADFQDFLKEHSKGEGASSYFNRFKKMIKQAFKNKLISTNPAALVKTLQGNAKKKDILTLEEIQLLANTPTESLEVRRAFLFSCLTGLRWVDVSTLRWNMVNLKNKHIVISQSKTEKDVHINLNDTAIKILGEIGKKDESVFSLPTANGANKTLKAWTKRAGISKKITWHNARHSFGTNLIYHGADVTTASNLLGHTSLKHTQRYVKAANDLKEKATDKLNFSF
jgi:integrase/recombinase XerD